MLDFVEQPKLNIAEHFEQMLTSCLEYEDYERTGKIRGAQMAHQCTRVPTRQLTDLNSLGMTGYSVVAAESGKAVEEHIKRNLLQKFSKSVLLWDEFIPKVNDMGLNFSGILDLLLALPNGDMVVVDIKTTQRIGDEKRVNIEDVDKLFTDDKVELLSALNKSKGGIRKSPMQMEKYDWQVLGYAVMLDIEHALVYVVSRSKETWNQPVTTDTSYQFVTDEMKYDVICRMMMAHRLSDQYALPAKPKHFKKTVHCKYCDYWSDCWEGQTKYKELTVDETQELYDELYPEAVELYETYRGRLASIRDAKIKDTATLKKALAGDPKAIKDVLTNSQINIKEFLFNVVDYYIMDGAKQFNAKARFFMRNA